MGSSVIVAKTRIEVPEFRVRHLGWPDKLALTWSVLPEVAMVLIGSSPPGTRKPVHAAADWARNLVRAVAPAAGPKLTRVGSVLVVDTSVQTERVTAPLVAELARRHGESSQLRLPRLGPRRMAAAIRDVRGVGVALSTALEAAEITEPPGLGRELLKVEVLRRRAALARLSSAGIDAVVVGTQQNSSARALLTVAQKEEITSYYLPHAPTAGNAFYRDIPTSYALLRGSAEVDFYSDLGVGPTSRLMVVGNPGASVMSQSSTSRAPDVVYAPSPHPPKVLGADIDVIRGATDRPVTVCLHPRMRGTELADLFPRQWDITDAPNTDSYLRENGADVVIQHGSGVGLEVLALGIEVIDLCHPGEKPNYPYIREPHVQIAHDASELRSALEALPRRVDDRAARITFARSWCAEVGEAAARRCADAIERSRTGNAPAEVLLDGWARFLSES